MSGGFAPSPTRTGASAGTQIEAILRSLLDARGTAYDDGSGTLVYAETAAHARAIWATWSTLRRLANQFDPTRMTDFLPRWEKILGIHPASNASDVSRRNAVRLKMLRYGQPPTIQGLTDLLRQILPNTYSGVVQNSTAQAVTHIAAGANIPGGINVPVEPSGSAQTWSSSVADIPIQVASPAWMSESDFYREADSVYRELGEFVPAWSQFHWFRDGSIAGEFVLDETHNLDNERLGPIGTIAVGNTLVELVFPSYVSTNQAFFAYSNYYAFTLVSPTSVTATLTCPTASFDLYLMSGRGTSGAVLGSDGDAATGLATVGPIALAAGTYTLECSSGSGVAVPGVAPGTFTVTLA